LIAKVEASCQGKFTSDIAFLLLLNTLIFDLTKNNSMKKFTSVLCVLLFAAVAVNAQEFKKFSVGVGLGYAKPGGEGAGGGVLFAVEPAYRLSDVLQVGLRMETAVVVRGLSESATSYNASAAGLGSYTLNGKYYFSNNKFRPFAGAGFGLYSLAAVTVSDTGGGAAAESKIGFYPRVGFDLGHFNITLDYNLIGATTIEDAGGGADLKTKNSYFGFRIGGFFGGGRK
jgi:hypothetical protein